MTEEEAFAFEEPLNRAVFASADGDLELVAAEGRTVFIAGGLECEEIATLNGTATRLRSVVNALEPVSRQRYLSEVPSRVPRFPHRGRVYCP